MDGAEFLSCISVSEADVLDYVGAMSNICITLAKPSNRAIEYGFVRAESEVNVPPQHKAQLSVAGLSWQLLTNCYLNVWYYLTNYYRNPRLI